MAETILISRYASRKLYNTNASEYVTIDDIADLIRDGHTIEVRDKKTNEDLTRQVLLQIIAERESQGDNILPINVLTEVVRNYNAMQDSLIPEFLARSFDVVKQQQDAIAEQMTQATRDAVNPLNMFETAIDYQRRQAEMMTSFASSWMPGSDNDPLEDPETRFDASAPSEETETDPNVQQPEQHASDEIAELKAQVKSLQEQLKQTQKGSPT